MYWATILLWSTLIVTNESQVPVAEPPYLPESPEALTTHNGTDPLQGTPSTRPAPPLGVTQRRLTHTAGRPFPGLQGAPRFWPRSPPCGSRVGAAQARPRLESAWFQSLIVKSVTKRIIAFNLKLGS